MLCNLMTDVAKNRDIPISESALFAILGFVIVFVGIAFLILVVWLIGKAIHKGESKNTKEEQPKIVVEQPVAASTAKSDEISEEVVAAITAALMAYYQKTNAKCEFRVKRIKRI